MERDWMMKALFAALVFSTIWNQAATERASQRIAAALEILASPPGAPL